MVPDFFDKSQDFRRLQDSGHPAVVVNRDAKARRRRQRRIQRAPQRISLAEERTSGDQPGAVPR